MCQRMFLCNLVSTEITISPRLDFKWQSNTPRWHLFPLGGYFYKLGETYFCSVTVFTSSVKVFSARWQFLQARWKFFLLGECFYKLGESFFCSVKVFTSSVKVFSARWHCENLGVPCVTRPLARSVFELQHIYSMIWKGEGWLYNSCEGASAVAFTQFKLGAKNAEKSTLIAKSENHELACSERPVTLYKHYQIVLPKWKCSLRLV